MAKNKTYCWKCDKEVEMTKEKETLRKNNAIMLKGNCKDCDTSVIKFVKTKRGL
jgi:hypothetical protein